MKKFIVVMSLFLGISVCLWSGVYSGGDGSSGTPYQIANLDDLLELTTTSADWGSYFIQTTDIDASETETWNDGAGWLPIGRVIGVTDTKFHGFYDGDGHVISNLFINRPNTDNVGLFGHVGHVTSTTEATTIENLGLLYPDIRGGRGSGSLMGRVTGNQNTLTQYCYSMYGSVTGDAATGGLIGSHNSYISNPANRNYHPIMQFCFANNDVQWSRKSGSAAFKIGGLTGCNQKGIIKKSYARSSVTVDNDPSVSVSNDDGTSPSRVGGISGCIIYRGYIENSFSTGLVTTSGTVNNVGGFVGRGGTSDSEGQTVACFWDTQTSGRTTSSPTSGCTGLTTSSMKTESTFTGAGWDLTTIWDLDVSTNDGYPYLIGNTPPDVPLPITLASFSAHCKNGKIELVWSTESETENSHFLIYRNNEVIGLIAGAGTCSETHNYTFVDAEVIPGVTYTYVLADVDHANNETRYEDNAVILTFPNSPSKADFVINSTYPNPFNPSITISYQLSSNAHIKASLYNANGDLVSNLLDCKMMAGSHELVWNAAEMPSGIYILNMLSGNIIKTKKLILLK